MPPHQLLDIFIGGIVVFFDVSRVDFPHAFLPAQFEATKRILAALPDSCEVIDAAPAAELMQGAIDEIVPTGGAAERGSRLPLIGRARVAASRRILRATFPFAYRLATFRAGEQARVCRGSLSTSSDAAIRQATGPA